MVSEVTFFVSTPLGQEVRQAVHLQTSTNPTHITGTAGSTVNKTEESSTAAKSEPDAPTKTTDEDEKGEHDHVVRLLWTVPAETEMVDSSIYHSTPISIWFEK